MLESYSLLLMYVKSKREFAYLDIELNVHPDQTRGQQYYLIQIDIHRSANIRTTT